MLFKVAGRNWAVSWTDEGWVSEDPAVLSAWNQLIHLQDEWAVTATGPFVGPEDPLVIYPVLRLLGLTDVELIGEVPPFPGLPARAVG